MPTPERTATRLVRSWRRASQRAAIGAFTALALSGTAWATVIEISANGDTVTYAGPAIFTADGARPIAPPPPTSPPPRADVDRLIQDAARRHNLNANLLGEVARRESGFRQSAVSRRDAVGVMQLTAGTALSLGVDRYDTAQNIHGGAAYLRQMLDRYRGDRRLALAAYNAGPGAVDRYRGVPPYRETQDYVAAILARLPSAPAISVLAIPLVR